MCEPTTILMAASMAMTAIGGYQQAQAQRAAGNANAQIAENNARLAEQQAHDTQVLATRDQQQSAWRTRALIGQQKAAIAANGLDMDVGTPLDLMKETAMFGKADEDAIGLDATRKAWGYQAEAINYRNQGAQAKWAGKAQSRATILSTIGGLAGQAYTGFQNGTFGAATKGSASTSIGTASMSSARAIGPYS